MNPGCYAIYNSRGQVLTEGKVRAMLQEFGPLNYCVPMRQFTMSRPISGYAWVVEFELFDPHRKLQNVGPICQRLSHSAMKLTILIRSLSIILEST